MTTTTSGKREKFRIQSGGFSGDLDTARTLYAAGEYLKAIDVYEQVAAGYPDQSYDVLAELYDRYLTMPQRDRYNLYQSRHFDFGIRPGDKVLDIGSGHIPFPFATHLGDITLEDHTYGRAGAPFKYVSGRPVFECSVERMPFGDKEFDFVYCSHVLEHTKDPEQACRELMRVGRRGYIETPSRAKDIFLNSAKTSNHTRYVELSDGKLVFADYSSEEIEGFQCDILQSMHCAPQTLREKVFAALIWLKADLVNTMLLWDGSFEFEIRKKAPVAVATVGSGATGAAGSVAAEVTALAPKFLQVHTFYNQYLEGFYQKNPQVAAESFASQTNELVRDGFSGIHIFAPYMSDHGYETHFIVANNTRSQVKWLQEHGNYNLKDSDQLMQDVVRLQVETIKPDVLYLSDPINFDSAFVRSLAWQPAIVLGWRAANIPSGIDWSSFDIMLSSLSSLRNVALELGARSAEYFFPGYPTWINRVIESITPKYDVVFSGSWTPNQHPRRNQYLMQLANAASDPVHGFSCGFYINCAPGALPVEVQRYNLGEQFGVNMHAALRTGRIVVDARGILEYRNPKTNIVTDLAGRETANMRIFEVTGSGRFLLAEHYDNIADYFVPGVEIETFRDEIDLVAKIEYYLAHPDEREAIARRGQERCLREYSMEKRAAELDRIIRTSMTEATNGPVTDGGSVAALQIRAVQLINSGDIHAAFNLLVKAKALKQPLEGLDVLRAHCFIKMGQLSGALEALREEVRWFPGNSEARKMLDSLQAQSPESPKINTGDEDFNTLLEIIRPYTMLSEQRLYSLYRLAKHVCEKNIQGNFVECGVAAGGSSALLAWVIKRYSTHPRRLFSFDSFSGMPRPTEFDSSGGVDAESTGWGTGTCAAPVESVKEICTKLGAEDVLTTVKGYFEDTLPQMRDWVGMVAMLHMDGDWYESTTAILNNLYDRLTNGAFIQVDDYGHWDGCRKAIHEFTATRSLQFDIKQIDGTGVWFTKPDTFPVNQLIPRSLVDDFMQDDPVPQGIVSQMSANERFQLYYAVRTLLPKRLKPVRFVEIGSFSGASLVLTCKALLRMGIPYQGISVEPGGTPQFHEVIELLKRDIVHLPLFSHEASLRLSMMFDAGNLPEFIFVDGDHTYDGVKRDIIDYYRLLAPGGIMLFHDYLPELDDINRAAIHYHHGDTEPGIRRACKEVLEENYRLTPLEFPLLYPQDPTQTQAQLPIIPGVFSTVRAYRKPYEPVNANIHPTKIVQLCTSTFGGAARAAIRLHNALRASGADSTFLTLAKDMTDPTIKVIHGTLTSTEPGNSNEMQVAADTWHRINSVDHPNRPQGLEMFSVPDSNVVLGRIDEIMDADIVHLHWVAGLADYDDLGNSLFGKKVLWTLHDMNPFTGGCHYAGECLKYLDSCGSCPQLGSSTETDLSRRIWEKKHRGLKELDITVLTPSRWLASCAMKSSIFKDSRIVCIPNSVPVEIFRPFEQLEIRNLLSISSTAQVVLFGADNLGNHRKGFAYLLEALRRFQVKEGTEIVLTTFGRLDSSITIESPYPLVQLGNICEESHLASIYSMADMFVIPSLEDNLPNTVLESMACGTPVLGFAIGGIPDMIEHKETGYLAEPKSVDGLVDGINWLINNTGKADLRNKCRSKAESLYSLRTQAKRVSLVYNSILGNKFE